MRRRPGLLQLVFSTFLGAALGGALLLLELWLLKRSGLVGFSVNLEGPYAAVFSAIRPRLPELLLRVAALYLAGGAALGVGAGVLASALVPPERRSPWRWAALCAAQWLVLLLLLAWDRAILRPALVDDLAVGRWALGWLLDHGEPWHPRVAALLWCLAHLAAGLRGASQSVRRLVPVAALLAPALAWVAVRPAQSPAAWEPSAQGAVRPTRPLVVLIGIDAFRTDRLGRKVAPNLERFLGDATLFDSAYTPIAQTEPAWRSILTSRWPHRHGVRYPLTGASHWADLPTFPAALTRAGFLTEFHTDCSRFNFQDERSGFAVRIQPPRGALNFALERMRFRGVGLFGDNALGARLLPELVDNRALAGIHDPLGYAERLGERLASVGKAGPTFFAFHATAAHFPGDPTYPHYRRFVSPQEPVERRTRMTFSPIGQASQGGWTREGAQALYDELLAQADQQLGILLGALRRSGLYEEATVIVFSDHGESFHADFPALAGATPVHGARLGDEENRVLLAIKLPASRSAARPARVSQLVRLLDLGPTVLELAGAPPLPGADGVSLLPLLEGRSLAPLRLYAETGYTHASPAAFDPGHAARAPRSFEAYRVHPDGIIELTAEAHEAILQEKDVGATDGKSWLVRSARANGTYEERCRGDCAELARFLSDVAPAAPSLSVR